MHVLDIDYRLYNFIDDGGLMIRKLISYISETRCYHKETRVYDFTNWFQFHVKTWFFSRLLASPLQQTSNHLFVTKMILLFCFLFLIVAIGVALCVECAKTDKEDELDDLSMNSLPTYNQIITQTV